MFLVTYTENVESLRPKIEVATGKMNEVVLSNQHPNIADRRAKIADKASNIAGKESSP